MDSPRKKLFHAKKNDDIIDSLGEDLLIKILSNLPVNSVFRCRSVSKTWYTLTKTDYFADKHFANHHRRRSEPHRRDYLILITKQPQFNPMFEMFCAEKENLSPLRMSFVPNELKNVKFGLALHGSSNGLVCSSLTFMVEDVRDRDLCQILIIIWNPATQQYRELPKPDTSICSIPFSEFEGSDIFSDDDTPPVVGFEFINQNRHDDEVITSEYKLARVFCHASGDDSFSEKTRFEALILIQRTNSWRRARNDLELGFRSSRCTSDPLTLNGVLYWKMQRMNTCVYVASFDLDTEVFGTIQLPTYLQNDEFVNCRHLYSWRNSLAISAYHAENHSTWIWVTRNENGNTVWIPQFRITNTVFSWLMRSWKDQLIFLSDSEIKVDGLNYCDVFSYDPKTQTRRRILKHLRTVHSNIIYVESLARV